MINLRDPELVELYEQHQSTRQKLVEKLLSQSARVDKSYSFSNLDRSDITLEDLFDGRDDLILIHNMGKSCRWCMLWADGINGLLDHLQVRSAVALVNPDSPSTQKEFAESRGWAMNMVQDASGQFTEDLNFGGTSEDGKRWVMPGVSTFHRNEDGSIQHMASDMFGPGDVYMPVYPLFELLKDGASTWEPQYKYQKPVSIDVPTNGS